ncbi:MAG: hypothetical protein U0360_06990 [Dehalococcoidia bacterium]
MTLPADRRRARALAFLREVGGLAGWTALALAAACGVLLVRTQAGREPVSPLDAAVAASLILAVPPAWFARHLVPARLGQVGGNDERARAATPGLARAALRALLHPLAAMMWAWSALVVAAAGAPIVALILVGMATLVAFGGVISFALWIVAPSKPALHDLAARLWPAARGSNE